MLTVAKTKFYTQNVQLSAQWHLLSGENMVQVKFITRALALNEWMETGTQYQCSKIKSSYVKLRAAQKKNSLRATNARDLFWNERELFLSLFTVHRRDHLKNNIFLHTNFLRKSPKAIESHCTTTTTPSPPSYFPPILLSYFSHAHFFFSSAKSYSHKRIVIDEEKKQIKQWLSSRSR